MPYAINPSNGYIVSSNNPLTSSNYKYIIPGSYIMDSRARAMEDEIEAYKSQNKKIDINFINDNLLKNVKDSYCPDILNYYFKLLNNQDLNSNIGAYFLELKNFDCKMTEESKEALVFNVLENEILLNFNYTSNTNNNEVIRSILISNEERSNYFVYKLKAYVSNPFLCLQEYNMSCSEFLLKNMNSTYEYIKHRLGPDTSSNHWVWKNINLKHFPHKPFSFIPFFNSWAHRAIKTDVLNFK